MLQNQLYFMHKKTYVVILFFISSNFEFYLTNSLFYIGIDQGIHKVKLKVARNEKQIKLHWFSSSINIANFEAFCRTKKLISNLFFLKSDSVIKICHILYMKSENHQLPFPFPLIIALVFVDIDQDISATLSRPVSINFSQEIQQLSLPIDLC